MQIKLTQGEIARELSHGTKNLDAYLKVLKANFYGFKMTPESYIQAKKLLNEAIILDSEYALPYVFLGMIHIDEAHWGFSKSPKKSIEEASKLAQKGLEMDDSIPPVH